VVWSVASSAVLLASFTEAVSILAPNCGVCESWRQTK
jgi:hypothetical protein